MKIVAYCAAEFAASTRRAAGVRPLTSPPLCDLDGIPTGLMRFDPQAVRGADLVYLALHGQEWGSELYGDGGLVALRFETVMRMELLGAVVFAETCWLPGSPLLEAFLEAGASAVIAGQGENWAYQGADIGVNLLGRWFRYWFRLLRRPDLALRLAKARTLARRGTDRTDVAEFGVYYA